MIANTNIWDFSKSTSYSPLFKKSYSSIQYSFSNNLSFDLNINEMQYVYILIEDESKHHIWFKQQLKNSLKNIGCIIVKNPNKAQYILNVQLKKIGVLSYDELQNEPLNGYGSPLEIHSNELIGELTGKNIFYFIISNIHIKEWVGILNRGKLIKKKK